MKKTFLAIIVFLFSFQSHSQLLSPAPDFITESSTPVVITMDATKGNQGLLNYADTNDVYVHIGVITTSSNSPSDWKYSKFTWGTTPALAHADYSGNNTWTYTITGGLRTFFGITEPAETIKKIAILFRSGNGNIKQANTDGTDMYVPVFTADLAVRFTDPLLQPKYVPEPEAIIKSVGESIYVRGIANNTSTLKLYFNNTLIETVPGTTTITANPTITVAGTQTLVIEASDGITTKTDSLNFYADAGVVIDSLPPGVRAGINYEASAEAATLVLFAPGKTRVSVIGDFPGSAWVDQSAYQMNKTPDGKYWWIRLTGLTAGTEYSYQYLVDGTLKIADPYAEKILDPNDDASIPASTYPSLKSYPSGSTTGIVSILQTASPAYTWKVNNFSRPDKKNLLIYELLVRDFVAAHDWNTLKDTLRYIKNLGINTIELMPFNEFEGNLSWGYNPDYYFAPDKYYGPANTLKEFIDSCHTMGIAVVMDIALNHSFGNSPLVQLYFKNGKPADENPWFNPTAKHPYNVGFDMNHESLDTRYFVSRVVEHWLTNYKIDGFRFDLSKGFTQTNSCTTSNCNSDEEVSNWGHYDASRVAIWKRYYDTVQLKSAGAYTILEHFADNNEEIELSDYGMMLWGNANHDYNEASMGYLSGSNFSYGIYTSRGWTQPNLITYMESHDEERLMYKNIQYGNAGAGYNIKDTATALKREELNAAFFFTIPGPKMIWQFGELGYEYSITSCHPGNTIPQPYPQQNCRTDAKPIRWDYLQNAGRKHLYDVYSSLMKLRANSFYTDVFASHQITSSLGGAFKWLKVTKDISSLVVIGNFDVVMQTGSVTFPASGIWYDYLNGTTLTVTDTTQSFTLQPGEYHVYLNRDAALPVTLVNFSGKNTGSSNHLYWAVSNEENLSRYELQRSTNAQDYSFVTGINPSGSNSYTYADNITAGTAQTYFYRLKSIDKDGSIRYSAIVKIRMYGQAGFIAIAPNPFREKLHINIEAKARDRADLLLTDLSGRQILKKSFVLSSGNNAIDIEETVQLSNGTYLLTVITSTLKQSIKIIKNH